ncbi:MAG: NADH-quinone oxidoreductase subunit C [Pirellula sp.]
MTDESSVAATGDLLAVKNRLSELLTGTSLEWSVFRDQQRVVFQACDMQKCLKAFREVGFDQLTDLTAVDLLEYENATDRFELVYCLLNVDSGLRLIAKTHLNEPDLTVPSATPIWFGADWLEREVYDMYGVVFDGHPNFKRLLLPQEFQSFPLRKDYPVKGRGERHNFPVITRAES